MRSALGYFSVFALIVAGLLLVVRLLAPHWLQNENDQAQLIYLLLFLVLIGGGAFGTNRAQMAVALKQALTWLAIFLLVVVGYSFQQQLIDLGTRVRSEVTPSAAVSIDQQTDQPRTNAVAIRKSSDGQFHATGKVNSALVRFMVDTGASSVALTGTDARRAGINLDKLDFSIPISTASGQTFAASVTLDKVSIGQITLRNVDAFVLQEGLDISLLGMSFLGRLQKFEASRNQLILRK
ncbi:hypothetical protein MNBD_ALPHA06-860 [hydrothermal vent metagenome]|uniref:TIGR02281 family clan AA aspartic protease n=1 Tax=hydrothermal vent metagenome TaxID=652676 RepID=A0A3B0R468_9ZZZZ